MEVSVFYIRHPKNKKGKVTGFLHKIPMQVVGDGFSTLEQLIDNHPKANNRKEELLEKHKDKWDSIIAKDEKYMLSYAANHNRGAHFVDLKHHIDDDLVSIFDELSKKSIGVQVHYMPLHLHSFYKNKFGYKKGDFPIAEKYYNGAITLPLFPKMTNREVGYIVKTIKDIYKREKK